MRGDVIRGVLMTIVLAGGVASAGGSAAADEPLAATQLDARPSADGGTVAWLERVGTGRYRFRSAPVGGTRGPRTVGPTLRDVVVFDVGRAPGGGARIVWSTRCSVRAGRCDVLALPATGGTARTLTRIPYGGGRAPAVTVDGTRIAYARTLRTGARVGCSVIELRSLSGRRAHRVAGGTGCSVRQLDLDGPWLASVAAPRRSDTLIARVARSDGRGRSRALEAPGRRRMRLPSVALDGGRVYVIRTGTPTSTLFERFSAATGRRSTARAFALLAGGLARDRGRPFYVSNPRADDDVRPECRRAPATQPCLVVAGTDPWAGPRELLPELTARLDGPPLFFDERAELTGRLTRSTATRSRRGDPRPLAGVPVTLATAPDVLPDAPQLALSATTTTTADDGSWRLVAPRPPVRGTGYGAVAGPSGSVPVGSAPIVPDVWARVAVTGRRRSGEMVTLSGTIDPPLPGAIVQLELRRDRTCGFPPEEAGDPTPSTVDTPPGCRDLFDDLGDPFDPARVAADGRTFTVTAAGPPGIYRATMLGDTLLGETPQTPVP